MLRLRPTLLDQYIIREIVPPTSLGLLVFTFILLINEIPRLLGVLVAHQADAWTILRVFLNLLPSILAVTIPMAFLLGVLLAFGRLSSDSEIVALRSSGVSPLRLIVPVLVLSAATGFVTFYIHTVSLPAANQVHRELVFKLVVNKATTAVRPRTFTEKLLPGGMMLYVSDIPAESGEWTNVLIHDRRQPPKSRLILSRTGRLVLDEPHQSVRVELGEGVRHTFDAAKPRDYDQEKFRSLAFSLPFDEFFPKHTLSKGDREMTLGELSKEIRDRLARGDRKAAARFEVEWHKKFAISTACLVFGLLGLGLSLGNRKEARSAAFALSIAVIFVYYVLIRLGEQAGDTGLMPPFLSMWGANLVLGAAAVVLLALNHREAAFDPLDARHYLGLLPALRREKPARAPVPRPRRRPTTTVVLRIPRINLRFPTLIDRYVARSYVGYVLLVLTAFVSIYVLAHFMDLFDDIQQHKVKGRVVLHYYAFYSVAIVYIVAPVAVLVGVLVTFGVLARRNEVTAMKAGGLSVYRIAAPLLAMGLFVSVSLFALQEFVLPNTNRIAERDYNVIKGRPPQASSLVDRSWILATDGRFYNYDYLVRRPAETGTRKAREEFSLYGLSVYDVDAKSWELREQLYTRRASWNERRYGYDLDPGHRLTLLPAFRFRPFEQIRVRGLGREPGGELEPPDYFKKEVKPYETMSFEELRRHIASVEAMGFDVIPLRVQLNRKLSFPMVGLVMTLLGIPFSFVVARRGALYGIGVSIIIAIVYWACLGTFEALGNNAILPPALASWTPNLLFGAAGLYLLLTLET